MFYLSSIPFWGVGPKLTKVKIDSNRNRFSRSHWVAEESIPSILLWIAVMSLVEVIQTYPVSSGRATWKSTSTRDWQIWLVDWVKILDIWALSSSSGRRFKETFQLFDVPVHRRILNYCWRGLVFWWKSAAGPKANSSSHLAFKSWNG